MFFLIINSVDDVSSVESSTNLHDLHTNIAFYIACDVVFWVSPFSVKSTGAIGTRSDLFSILV